MKLKSKFLPALLSLLALAAVSGVPAGYARGDGPTGKPETQKPDKPDDQKVTMCHDGHTIEVKERDVAKHLAHGDTLGPCEITPKVTMCHRGHTIEVKEKDVAKHLAHGDTLGPCQITPSQNK